MAYAKTLSLGLGFKFQTSGEPQTSSQTFGGTSFNFDVFIFVMWGERYFCTTTIWSDSGLSLPFALVLLTNFGFHLRMVASHLNVGLPRTLVRNFDKASRRQMEQMKGFNSLSKLVNRFALILDLHSFQERLLDACYGTILLSLGQSLFVFIFISFLWSWMDWILDCALGSVSTIFLLWNGIMFFLREGRHLNDYLHELSPICLGPEWQAVLHDAKLATFGLLVFCGQNLGLSWLILEFTCLYWAGWLLSVSVVCRPCRFL